MRLPAVEAALAGSFSASHGESDQPEYEENDRHYPEKMQGEAESRKEKYHEKCE
jgi:hypothetical protein